MSWLTPDLIDILLSILKAVVILLVVVTCGAFMSFGERRLLGLFQNRYGPNRVGWGGSLQLVADMIKMFFKEDWIPRFSDRVIFTLAPVIAFTSLLLAFAIVPVSPTWVVADLNIGILFFLMMAGLAVYAVLFAGWSSNNKYSLLGAMRASAQTLSYEVFLGLSPDGRGGAGGVIQYDRYRQQPGASVERHPAVLRLRDFRHRRRGGVSPSPVRPAGSGAGTGRWLPH